VGMSPRWLLCPGIAVALLAGGASRASAEDYPTHNVTIIVPFTPAGSTDILARMAALAWEQRLGKSFVVENRPGAGQQIGVNAVAKAAPDGYTVLTIGPGVSVVAELYPSSSVDVRRDLQPVSVMGVAPMVLLAHKDVPVTDYPSLLAYLKAHPNELTTGSNGRGSAGHLAGALFKNMAGVDIRYIPYRTTPQAQTDLIGGRLSMMWLSTLTDHIQAGTLRPIAVTTLDRWKQFPDTPTFDELGLKGYEATTWISMYLPKGASPEVNDKLAAALNAALADPSLRERLDQAGIIAPRSTGPDFLARYLKFEIDKWADILRTNKDAD